MSITCLLFVYRIRSSSSIVPARYCWLGFSNGNSEITDLAVALGKFLRASIKREDYYTVKQEMEVVDNYLFIQKYRFGDKIEIRHNIPDEVLNFYIPSFIIQPVIENSIVHGLEEQIEKGILWINIQLCDNKYLQFNLTDNGKGMDEEQLKQVIQNYSDKNKKSSIGLSNVYRRLNLLYGEACEFHVTSVAGEGRGVLSSGGQFCDVFFRLDLRFYI